MRSGGAENHDKFRQSTVNNSESDGPVLAGKLLEIASQVAKLRREKPGAIFSSTNEALDVIRRIRAHRSRYFPVELFADPAWDIFLELKHAENEQFRVSVTTLCAKIGVPPSTGLRWITSLVEKGILVRTDDLFDNRRVYLTLSPTTSVAIGKFLQDIADG